MRQVVMDAKDARKFEFGEYKTDACPAGTQHIEDEKECQDAAVALGLTYAGKNNGNSFGSAPTGCHQWGFDALKYSEQRPSGKLASISRPLCQGPQAKTVTFKEGPINTDACPAPWEKVLSEQQCEEVAAQMNYKYSGTVSQPDQPKGCYLKLGRRELGESGEMFLNTHSVGSANLQLKPICALTK